MNKFINFIAFQIIWFIAVIGAANDILWPTMVAVCVFCAWQLAPSRRHSNDVPLIIFALIFGLIFDSFWQLSGLITYKLALPMIAPIWILLLWITLALSMNHSLAWLKRNNWFPIFFGAIGAPASYYAGNRLGALSYPNDAFYISLLLSISWAFVMYFFVHYERLFQRKALQQRAMHKKAEGQK